MTRTTELTPANAEYLNPLPVAAGDQRLDLAVAEAGQHSGVFAPRTAFFWRKSSFSMTMGFGSYPAPRAYCPGP